MYVKDYFNCVCVFVLVDIHSVEIKRRKHIQTTFLGYLMM